MKKEETILCHTFIGTLPLVIVKRFLFEDDGQEPRQMCVVKDCPVLYMGRFWMPGYAVADYMSGFIFPHSSNVAHDASPREIVEAFFEKMRELGMSPNDITAAVKEAKPEDAKWSASDLSALPCVVKEHVKRIHGIYL